ncbi:MAG: hypothetical protein IJX16_02900 [Clostridia bacterium]|nr:hypothetical protein [Clostridia bacterium]
MSDKENIHSGHRERMMQKLVNDGDNLLEHELLEILLFAMLPRVNTNPIAHRLIKTFGSVNGVLNASVSELSAVNGIGVKTAKQIRVIGLLFSKANAEKITSPALKNFEMVKKEAIRLFKGEKEERFCLLLLNSVYKRVAVIDFYDEKAFSVSAEVPDIAKAFALYKPKHAIIAHNHPSGLAEPSERDDLATKKINLLCMAHSVSLTDHVIYANDEVYSYAQSGKLDEIKKKADLNELLKNL